MNRVQWRQAAETDLCFEEYQALRCGWANEVPGNLPGEDCPHCRNRGYTHVLVGSEIKTKPCPCMVKRNALRRMEKSGLGELLRQCTFGGYRAETPWQQQALARAKEFTNQRGKWFFIGGAVGSGKTHLCTAICGQLMAQGLDCRYMLWREESRILKAAVNDNEEYSPRIEELKNTPVLYIDDLFKTRQGGEIRDGDVNLAFEIIGHRYIQSGSITVISCERTMDELLALDEGTASRIDHRSQGFCLEIARGQGKNWRLK